MDRNSNREEVIMYKHKKVDDKTFNTVKRLLASGWQYKEISEMLDISRATIGRISQAKSPEEYTNNMKTRFEEQGRSIQDNTPYNNKEIEHKVTIVADRYMAEQLKKLVELMTLNSNKLTNMMENIEAIKEALM